MGSNSSSVPTSALACWGSKSEIRNDEDESAGDRTNVGRKPNTTAQILQRWETSLCRWTVGAVKLVRLSLLTCFLLSGASRQQTELIQNGGGWGGSGGEGAGGAVVSQQARGCRDQGTAQQRVLCSERVCGWGGGTKTGTWISDLSRFDNPASSLKHFSCYGVSIFCVQPQKAKFKTSHLLLTLP